MEKKIELTVSELSELINDTVASTVKAMKNDTLQKESKADKFYTRQEIMSMLRIPPPLFTKLAKQEGFPGKFIGKSWLIPKQEFNEWITKNQIGLF